MDIQNTSLFILIISLVLILLYKNERYNSIETFKNNEKKQNVFEFLGNKLVDYKNVKLKNVGFNSEAVNSILFTPDKGPVALASGDIHNTGQIQIKLDTQYEITGLIIEGMKKFSMKYYCGASRKFKPVYGSNGNTIFINKSNAELIVTDLKTKSGLAVITNQVNIYNQDNKQSDGIKFQLYGMPLGNTIKKFLKLGYELPLQIVKGSNIIDTVSNLYKGQIITDRIINLSSRTNDNFIVKSLSFNSTIKNFKLFYKSKNDKEYKIIDKSLEILGSHNLNETFTYYFKHPVIMNKLVLVVLSTINDSSDYFIKNVKLFVESTERSRQVNQQEIDSYEGFQNTDDSDQDVIVEMNNKCELLNLYDQNKTQQRRTQINKKLIQKMKKQEQYIHKLNESLKELTDNYKKNMESTDNNNILKNHVLKKQMNARFSNLKPNNNTGRIVFN